MILKLDHTSCTEFRQSWEERPDMKLDEQIGHVRNMQEVVLCTKASMRKLFLGRPAHKVGFQLASWELGF